MRLTFWLDEALAQLQAAAARQGVIISEVDLRLDQLVGPQSVDLLFLGPNGQMRVGLRQTYKSDDS